jgi:hypothetical protein
VVSGELTDRRFVVAEATDDTGHISSFVGVVLIGWQIS